MTEKTKRYLKLAAFNSVFLLLHIYMGLVGNFSDAGLGAVVFGVISIGIVYIYSFIYGIAAYLYTKRFFVPQLMFLVTVYFSYFCMLLSWVRAIKATLIFVTPSLILALITKLIVTLIERKKKKDILESSNQP
ncbi:MAG: hypothetical protein IJF58_05155 [Clostridia bacterium]|nr:hypothetical protein [Clostridia bacterium]